MPRRRMVTEEAVRRLVKTDIDCCMSCHEDYDYYGYSLILLDLGKNREAEVCCHVSEAFRNWKKGAAK